MNLTKQLTNYFDKTKNIYINIAIVLVIIIIFIVFPLPLPSSLLFTIKIIIVFSLSYLVIENFLVTTKFVNKENNKSPEILEKTIILSNLVNLALIILTLYIWYIIFF